MKPITIHAREALYMRCDHIPKELRHELIEKYKFRFYEEKACAQCEFFPERHSEICDECGAYKGSAELASTVMMNGHRFIKTPMGDRSGLIAMLNDNGIEYVVKKHYPDVPFSRPIKFLGELFEYQEKAVQDIIKKKRGVLKAPPRSGKCIEGSSLIMTEAGLHPIRELFDADDVSEYEEFVQPKTDLSVATVRGIRQVAHTYSKVVDETIRVTTREGYSIRATPNHKVLVLKAGLTFTWVRMDDVRENDWLVVSRRKQWLGMSSELLELTDGMPSELTPELARLLGYLIANGTLATHPNSIGFTTGNEQVRNDYVHCMRNCFNVQLHMDMHDGRTPTLFFNSAKIKRFLQSACDLGMHKSNGKYIPKVVLSAKRELLLEFLSAYVSCDSAISSNNIELCSASKRLMNEVHVVLSYLGVIGKLNHRKGRAYNGHNIERDYWRISLNHAEAENLLCQLTLRKDHDLTHNDKPSLRDVIPHPRKTFSKGLLRRPFRAKEDFVARASIDSYVIRDKLSTEMQDRLRQVENVDYFFSPVMSIKTIHKPIRVYDVEVPKGRHFIANALVNHNTVMICAAICRLGKKTIILGAQREWLLGFQETFIGSETQEPLTNCRKEQIGFARKLADFERLDICLVTPQTFLHHPELLDQVRDAATIVAVDEVHTGAAPNYAKVISKLNCEYLWGASGTPNRKDGRYVLMRNLAGPTIVDAKVKRLRPEIRLVRTQFKANYKGAVPWVTMVRALEKDPKRLNLIARWAVKDASRGHMILIPLAQVTPIKALAEAINKIAGKTIAQAFTGSLKKKDRDLFLQQARQYKIKVLVGTTKLLSTGTNIPRASCLYDVTMSSNMENCEQRTSRILTPWKDKPQPLLRIFLDDTNVRRNCLASEYYQCIKPIFKPIVSEVDEIALKEYLKKKSNNEQPFEW